MVVDWWLRVVGGFGSNGNLRGGGEPRPVVVVRRKVVVDATVEEGLICWGESCIHSPCLVAFWEITFRFYNHR